MSTLEAKNLAVSFTQRGKDPFLAVDDVSFTLHPGKTVALVGESGSGKSTIVRALAGLQRLTSGQVLIDGQALRLRSGPLRNYRRHVQTVFQDPFASLNPVHTVEHHLARPLRIHGRAGSGRGGAHGQVLDLLGSVNLTPPDQIAGRKPHELSGGQRQRVAIARALAPEPSVLLADEPVSMLDVSVRLEILNLLADLERDRNLAMLYVTHDLATARHFSDEILVLYKGRVVERGPADSVILAPAHPYTKVLAAAIPNPRRRRSDPELEAARKPKPARPTGHETGGCAFAPRCPFAMEQCWQTAPPEREDRPGHWARCWLIDGPGAQEPTQPTDTLGSGRPGLEG